MLINNLWKSPKDGGLVAREALCPFPQTLPCAGLPSGCSGLISFYNKLVIYQVKCFPEFCELPWHINSTQGEGCGNLWFEPCQSKVQVTSWTCDWCLKLGWLGVLWDWALGLWGVMLSTGGYCPKWMSCLVVLEKPTAKHEIQRMHTSN